MKVVSLLVGRIILSIVLFLNGSGLALQRDWVNPPFEKEWDFFINSLQKGKTEAILHVLLLIIVVMYDSIIINCYRNKKK